MKLLFVFNECTTDLGDVDTARAHAGIIMDALYNPHKPRPEAEWIGGKLTQQWVPYLLVHPALSFDMVGFSKILAQRDQVSNHLLPASTHPHLPAVHGRHRMASCRQKQQPHPWYWELPRNSQRNYWRKVVFRHLGDIHESTRYGHESSSDQEIDGVMPRYDHYRQGFIFVQKRVSRDSPIIERLTSHVPFAGETTTLSLSSCINLTWIPKLLCTVFPIFTTILLHNSWINGRKFRPLKGHLTLRSECIVTG